MKIKSVRTLMVGLLLLLCGSGLPLGAQTGYDPVNPPEPLALYNVKTVVSPAAGGYASGGGQFKTGTRLYISTSATVGFTFSHWTRNGVKYSEQQSFYYTVEDEDVVMAAVYDYTPDDPSEPSGIYWNHLWLTNNLEGSCTFNRASGGKADPDTYVQVVAYPGLGFVFGGWWQGATKVSDTESFYFLMPDGDTTLEARYTYDPTSPDEPQGSDQGSVENTAVGDIDGDGTVDVTDAVALLNAYLNGNTSDLNRNVADVNGDGDIDVTDAVEILNRYLNDK